MKKHLSKFLPFVLVVLVSVLIVSDFNPSRSSSLKTPSMLSSYPHDREAFTQGFVFHNGHLYESTGLYGRSSLRKVDLETGKVEKIHHLPAHLFGEGITILNDKIYQLTWKAKTGIIYELSSFEVVGFFNYPFEGWGITTDEKNLIISNGTNKIFFYDPAKSFKQVKEIAVNYDNKAVNLLNELEYINGKIYANIWQSNEIISIDPETGKVIDWYDLSSLYHRVKTTANIDVLNGIAFDKQSGRVFVTGKLWPRTFEIELD